MPTRYRQLEAPAQVDTSRFESGDAQAARSLAQTLSGFADVGFSIASEQMAKRGSAEGLSAAMTGQPLKKGPSSLTAYGKAYNNSALRSYAIKAEADAEDTAVRLEVEAGNDPEKFKATFGAAMRGALKEAPQEAVGVLQEIYGKRLSNGTQRLIQAQTVELRNKSRTDTSEGIARTTDRVANLRASDKPEDALEADEEELKLQLLIDGAELDGTLSRTEALSARQDAARSIVKQTVSARFRKELDNPYGNPIGFIQRLQQANRDNEALPPAEEEKLLSELLADLQQQNSIDSAARRQEEAEVKARYAAGDKSATQLLLSGQLNQQTLLKMVEAQELEPTTARTLLNELQSAEAAKRDDESVAFRARVNLLSYEESDLATMRGLTKKTRADLILKRREEAQGWKGTQAAREASARIDRALGIPEGGFLSGLLTGEQAEQRDRALSQWYDIVDSLPPAERQAAVLRSAEEIIGKVIRTNKATEAQTLRSRREALIKRTGNPEDMSKAERARFESNLKRIDDAIAKAEQEAARQ